MGDSDLIDAGMKAGFGPLPDESVLRRLEANGGKPPRVRLNGADGSPEPPPIAAPVRYRILGEIARGGVGVVLHGRDADLGRDVAMKVLRPEYAGNKEILERFLEEAQVGGQLQHPGIVPVYEMGLDAQKRAYFTMKLVKGQTLAALLKERPEPGADRRRFLAIYEQVAQTVAYAHARGVIHRDLKPSNIMVGAFGEVVVLDWGFAKVLAQGGVADERPRDETVIRTRRAGSGSESQAGSILGTPAYMPPEQALGQVEAVDTRADVFSLGAILCEILTGQPPYAGGSNDMLLLAAQGRVEDALARLDGCGAGDDLVRLAKHCLDLVPSKRPRDAGAVAQAVAAHLAGVDERARVAELAAAEARVKALAERRARRLTAGLAAAVVLTLAVGGGGAVWGEGERRARADRTRTDVGRALNEARALYGEAQTTGDPARWEAALAVARKARSLADAGGLVGGETAALVARVDGDYREATRERVLRARLEANRPLGVMGEQGLKGSRADLAAMLREYGVDVEALKDEEVVRRMRASPIPDVLADVLDAWATRIGGVRGPFPDEARRVLRLAKDVDPDPVRCRLRDALLSEGSALLLELAASPEALEHGPPLANRLSAILSVAGEHEAAVKFTRDAQRKWPDNFWLNYSLGIMLGALDPPRPEESVQFLAAAAALRPDFVFARQSLGEALRQRGDFDSAIETFRATLDDHPERLYLNYCIAGAHKGKGDLQDAVARWSEEALARPMDANVLNRLGEGRLLLADREGAAAAFREAVRLRPESAYAHHALARTLHVLNDFDGAVAEYREAVRLDPGADHHRSGLAGSLASAGRFDEAIVLLEDLLRWNWSLPEMGVALGMAQRQAGRLAESEATFRKTLEGAPNLPRAHLGLGCTLTAKGDPEGAILHFREAVRLKPDDWSAGKEAAELLVGQQRYGEAREILEKVMALEPSRGYPPHLFGISLLREGRFEEARGKFAAAQGLKVHPSWAADLQSAIRECNACLVLKNALPAILSGEREPVGEDEARDFADLCFDVGHFAKASALYGDREDCLLRAAAAAAMAGTGMGLDAPDPAARAELRGTALARLRLHFAAEARRPDDLATRRYVVALWRCDKAFMGVRGEALQGLPPPEREGWLALWRDVDAFLGGTQK